MATVFLASSITVGAAMNDDVKNLLWHISPEIAALLEPIESTVEYGGIKMEIVSAMQDEDMAVVYVTMQDVEGNRIDETLDIYDYSMSKGRSLQLKELVLILQRKQPLFDLRRLMGVVQISLS